MVSFPQTEKSVVVFRVLLLCVCLCTVLGCGGNSPSESPTESLKKQSSAALEAMQSLASAIEKKDSQGIALAVESLTASGAVDVQNNKELAKQIVDIYKSKVKDKLRGEFTETVKMYVAGIESQLK